MFNVGSEKMNKKTATKTIPAVMLLVGFILGVVCGIIFTILGVGYIVSQINVDNVNIDFNETQFIDYTYEKVQQENGGILKPDWRNISLYNYNIIYPNVTVYKWNSTTGKFDVCCYPTECGRENPPNCTCLYPIKCITDYHNLTSSDVFNKGYYYIEKFTDVDIKRIGDDYYRFFNNKTYKLSLENKTWYQYER